MNRILFFIRAYPSHFKVQLAFLFLMERIRIPMPVVVRYFNSSFVESRRILGFVYDEGGVAASSKHGMHLAFKIKGQQRSFFLRWDSSDFLVFEQVIIKKEYSPILELVNKYSINVNTIIDAGGNIGCTTIFLQSYFPLAKILTIEPDLKNFEALQNNINLNKFLVTCRSKALWHESTKVSLTNDHLDKRDWSVSVSTDGQGTIDTITINQLFECLNVDQLDVLKMDIEGSEANIFRNDKDLAFLLTKIFIVAIEIHHETDYDLISTVLRNAGFEIFKRSETIFGVNLRRLNSN